MAEKFIINGGKTLKGEIKVRGAKNAAFPILAATLLTDETCVIDNIPLIEDVFSFIEILKTLGKKVEWLEERKVQIEGKLKEPSVETGELIRKLRGSVLLLGPILARLKKFNLPQPGGCLIGTRPVSTHLDAFRQLGVEIEVKVDKNRKYFQLELKKEPNNKVILNEFSVTATENVLLFASFFEKETIINDFREGSTNILVSTPIIEVGIDIPEASIIVIESAERFGLSSLHQMRGRVGRNDNQA